MNSAGMKPDLDSPQAIRDFVARFYNRLLADAELASIFVEVAGIDLPQHLPRIEAFWCKLLLGEIGYNRHMMNVHREIHLQRPFTAHHFQRWLAHFETTLDAFYAGPYSERARNVARSIATNLEEALLNPAEFSQRTRPIENRALPIGTVLTGSGPDAEDMN
ncbi:MAG: group III truncated hemoglobin [Pseudomonadota bacterium]|nr:group III truncated hemoglobin [Pseudomonadota bacterium]